MRNLFPILCDFIEKNEGSRSVFPRIGPYKHYFEIGGLCTFKKRELLKTGKIARSATCIRPYMHFLLGGKIADIHAVVT